MTYGLALTLALLFGFALGGGYFGGLWLTVRRARHGRRTKRLLVGSFLLRSVLALTGFYLLLYLMGDRWEMVALGLVGFVGARQVLIRRFRPDAALASPTTDAADHGD
ncbi:MAG: hypothetical protein GVY12_15180 [Bacteroidetes bacterium]|jgi:F1F0 ATPase subunit 2|nr:hypothetical protein [Bacteroidota bacterium]